MANSADPNQTPHNAASDQGFHCLQIVYPFSLGIQGVGASFYTGEAAGLSAEGRARARNTLSQRCSAVIFFFTFRTPVDAL